ncbi:MAG: putative metal-binding motif-containing protein [Myxococcota bacterium]
MVWIFLGLALAGSDLDHDGYCPDGRDLDGDHLCTLSTELVAPFDCNDANAAVFPGNSENTFAKCSNDLDDDCDGPIDQAESTCAAWADNDNDGYCENASSCIDSTPGDCNDASAAMFPGNAETTAGRCSDGLDNDCDQAIDLQEASCATFTDGDGDGYCEATTSCVDGSSPNDCDDADPGRSPALYESTITRCTDGIDNDCDGPSDLADSGCIWRHDADGDGWCPGGQDTSSDGWCLGSELIDLRDCDDSDPAVNPDATEIPSDGIDQDCDSDELCYADLDGDDHGDPDNPIVSNNLNCNQPGESWDGLDCDDTTEAIGPGNPEVPLDGIDQDCDGFELCYRDADLDGYGSPTGAIVSVPSLACDSAGGSTNTLDCNDADGLTYPGAPEIPADGVDNDCSGGELCYVDTDGDGDGAASGVTQASVDLDCLDGTEAITATDCDESDTSIYGGAPEVADDGIDQDCNGFDLIACFADADGDRIGSSATVYSDDEDCLDPGESYVGTDCDDTLASVHPASSNPSEPIPAAPETCDGVDQDCDGIADNGAQTLFFRDADSDGYGDPQSSVAACSVPAGFVADASDCDDASDAIRPGADEVCDGVDQDCDGAIDEGLEVPWYADDDGDLFGDPDAIQLACARPSGFVADATDCLDADNSVYPGAPELCDFQDNDCNGLVDDDTQVVPFFPDDDGDGFGNGLGTTVESCAPLPGYVASPSDCDDTDPDINPGQPEICNQVDDDCTGFVDDGIPTSAWYVDLDGDGYGPTASAVQACGAPSGHVALSGDCDDGDPSRFPGAPEVCNELDDDCDTLVDLADPDVLLSDRYADEDGDGFGQGPVLATCDPTASDRDDDCDDGDPDAYPGAPEIGGDGIDQDCDGVDALDPTLDSDGDDLPDRVEIALGLDPYTAATDGAGTAPVPAYGCGCGHGGRAAWGLWLAPLLLLRRSRPALGGTPG